jgi:hypothetical protein
VRTQAYPFGTSFVKRELLDKAPVGSSVGLPVDPARRLAPLAAIAQRRPPDPAIAAIARGKLVRARTHRPKLKGRVVHPVYWRQKAVRP